MKKVNTVKIVPMGDIRSELIYTIIENLNELGTEGKIGQLLSLPEHAYNPKRCQFLGEAVLEFLDKEFERGDKNEKVLGIIDMDLYAKGLNFIFGQAKLGDRTAVISIYRLDPIFYGQQKNFNRLAERAVKEANHEIGHTYGLNHCSDSMCVMYFANSILDVDRKTKHLCEKCKIKIGIRD